MLRPADVSECRLGCSTCFREAVSPNGSCRFLKIFSNRLVPFTVGFISQRKKNNHPRLAHSVYFLRPGVFYFTLIKKFLVFFM